MCIIILSSIVVITIFKAVSPSQTMFSFSFEVRKTDKEKETLEKILCSHMWIRIHLVAFCGYVKNLQS